MFEKEDLKRFDERIIVFVLRFSKIDKYHVGYNIRPGKDLPVLYGRLSKGIHRSRTLQKAYDTCGEMEHVYYSVPDVKTARLIKTSLIEHYVQQGRSLNKQTADPNFKGMNLTDIVIEMNSNPEVWLPEYERKHYEKFVTLSEEHFEGLGGTDSLELYFNGELKSTSVIPATYVIRHVATNMFYVGSTTNIYSRLVNHRYMIRKGDHENVKLNEALNTCSEIEVCVYKSPNRKEAYKQEQHLITENWKKGILFNIADDVKNNFSGSVYKGYKVKGEQYRKLVENNRKNAEKRSKSVSIKNVPYKSVEEAMRDLDMGRGPINYRIASDKEEYKDWYYSI